MCLKLIAYNIQIKYDNDKIYDYATTLTRIKDKKNVFHTKIVFEPYYLDEKKFSLPIATFTTI